MQNKLGLDATASSTEETLVDRWLNEAVVDLLLRARVNVNTSTVVTTVGVDDYTLDTGILAIRDISSAAGRITRCTPADILRFRSASPATGTGVVTYYAVNGNDLLMIYPTPSSADTLTLYYTPRPTAMSTSAHDPSVEAYGGIPSEYHKAIELFALAQAAEYTDHKPSQYGARYKAEYEQKLVEIKRAMRHKGGRSLGPALVGRKRPLIGGNSQYPRG